VSAGIPLPIVLADANRNPALPFFVRFVRFVT
jgi:hypothetical protein